MYKRQVPASADVYMLSGFGGMIDDVAVVHVAAVFHETNSHPEAAASNVKQGQYSPRKRKDTKPRVNPQLAVELVYQELKRVEVYTKDVYKRQVPVYLFRCEAAGITEVHVHMTVYLISCRNLCLQFFPFQFFIAELWLIDRVEPKPGDVYKRQPCNIPTAP